MWVSARERLIWKRKENPKRPHTHPGNKCSDGKSENDGGDGRTMKNLARRTMAELGVQRLLPAQLIFDSSAMTAAFVQGFEVRVVLVDFVWLSEFPFIVLSLYLVILVPTILAMILLFLCKHYLQH